LILLTSNSDAKCEVVNVGNTQEITILELAEKIREATGCKSPIEFYPLPKDDPKRRCPNISKLEALVGWKPSVRFEEGLEKTVVWFSKKTSAP
jgi:nucleoside-diphosphate-sugar epimerase